jgi:hypothetical protein
MNREEIEHRVARGTTDEGRVQCLYHDSQIALVKWPGGVVNSKGGRGYVSARVYFYRIADIGADYQRCAKRRVWCCSKNEDGRLTAKRLAELITKCKTPTPERPNE